MKMVRYETFGRPHEVLAAVEQPDLGPPSPGEVALELLYAPIHPSDLNMVRGLYGIRPRLPASAGQEGVSRVVALGDGVDHLAVGDLVLTPYVDGTWRDRSIALADRLIALPAGIDPHQAAVLVANPLSALLMLTTYQPLVAGDWLIHNAANSAIGRCIIGIAHHRGLHTVNVVRRDDVIDELTAIGGDVVLVDGDDLASQVTAASGGAHIRLGLEAVGGASLAHLMGAVAAEGAIVTYAAVSGQPFAGSPQHLIYRSQTIHGFWVLPWLQRADPATLTTRQRELVDLLDRGAVHTQIEAVYPLTRINEAVTHTRTATGKVLLAGTAAES